MTKDSNGSYRNPELGYTDALATRSTVVREVVAEVRPTHLLIDRHPYGIGGEWRTAVEAAHDGGAHVVLGLRDILDEPDVVKREFAGDGWREVPHLFDTTFVYGSRAMCDHRAEYELPTKPTYVGWVVDRPPSVVRDKNLVVVTTGGGADGGALVNLALATARHRTDRRFLVVAGPYADDVPSTGDNDRVKVVRSVPSCAALYAAAGFVVQMAGYNSTFESLSAGVRPILMPRRAPRREQAIRATRLASLGLADVIDDATTPSELAWLLERPHLVHPSDLAGSGIRLDGARRAAGALDTARQAVA
jgi:predicted glycosyltransferase